MDRWLVCGVLVAFGCGEPGAADEGQGTRTTTDATTTTVTGAGESSSSSSSGDTEPGDTEPGDTEPGEATTDYPTHVSCEDSSAGYDVPIDTDGGEESGGAEDTTEGMGDDIPIGATVFQVRQNELPAGTFVEIADIVITSPAATAPDGQTIVFAQHPDGGMYSGIALRMWDASLLDDVAVGDRVRVRAHVGERYIFTALFLESEGTSLQVEGAASLPAPAVLLPADLLPGAQAAEAYESALIRVENPEVEEPDSCFGEFTIDAGVRVDDLFLGGAAPNPAAGDVFSAVSGPLVYTYNGFEIAPRTLADVEP